MRSYAAALLIIALLAGCAGNSGLPSAVGLPNPGTESGAAPNVFQPGSPLPRWVFVAPAAVSDPGNPVLGADHNIWYTGFDLNLKPAIDRITPDGHQRHFPVSPRNGVVTSMTLGLDGNVWFVIVRFHPKPVYLAIGKMTPSGSVTEYPLSNPQALWLPGIAAGPDGNLWVTCQNILGIADEIDKITPSGVETRFPLPSPPPGVTNRQPRGIVAGSDGAMWFAEASSGEIGRITVDGSISEFPLPAGSEVPILVVRAPDGNVWFSYYTTATALASIGKITPAGSITEYPNPSPENNIDGLTVGADGELWFGESTNERYKNTEQLGHLSLGGVYDTRERDIPQIREAAGRIDLATGSDGNLWVTEGATDRLAVFLWRKITVVPSSVTVRVGQTESIVTSETNYSGSWTASSSNRSTATVKPGHASGTFVVQGRASGTCNVTISDSFGNSYVEPVTVQ